MGEGVVEQLAQHLTSTQPGLKGFTHANLFRMRWFYEAYQAQLPDKRLLQANARDAARKNQLVNPSGVH